MCLFGLRIFEVSPQASHTFRHFHKLSSLDTYVRSRIKFESFTLGGICSILLHLNTRDLVLLLFYTTVSLDFGCCLISELTTHSPRMVNNQHHAHTPDSTRCDSAYEMQSCHFMLCHATCNIYKFRIIIFSIYNFHSSLFSC